MASEKDFMDQAVAEYMGIAEQEPAPPVVQDAEVPDKGGETDTPPVVEPEVPETPMGISQDDVLKKLNELTGMNFDSFDKVKDMADKYSKFPEIEEKAKIFPDLVDALEKMQNPLNYFRDETAFKVAMVSKDPKYQGKEDVLNEILRSDLSTVDDIKIIALATSLKARNGVRNPLRAELRGMNIDPDEVIDNYESLDDDTKDLLKIRADQYREELPKIGSDVKVPSFEGTVVEQLLNQKKATKEDLDAKMNSILPVAEGIIKEIKEMKITDDFSYKLDLTPDQVKSYSEELAELLVSGQYDLNTDSGKNEVYGAIMDMFKADHFDKAVSALRSHMTSQIEEQMRRKYNNEKPLDKQEPNPLEEKGDKDLITRAAEWLISQGR